MTSPTPRRSIADVLHAARARLERVDPLAAHDAVARGDARIVDVRTPDHLARDGHVPGALEVTLNVLEWRLDPDSPSRHPGAPGLDDLVLVMCEQGYSSSLAAARLQDLGFTRATDVTGGFEGWAAAGLPVRR